MRHDSLFAPDCAALPEKNPVLRVLVACEFSGTVRDAFLAAGHDALSCDLLPTESPGPHYQGDVRDLLTLPFDLMIAHPPCTHLAVSGARWFADKQEEQVEALDFVRTLLNAPIPMIAIENPVSIISSHIRKPDQIIQPWQFGHGETKKTCLWLKGLPKLQPTRIVKQSIYACRCGYRFDYSLGKYGCPNCLADHGEARLIYSNQTPTGQNNIPPGPNRWKERSVTYRGVAEAMAAQWGGASNDLVSDALRLSRLIPDEPDPGRKCAVHEWAVAVVKVVRGNP